jgi:polyisoprenoid-binding protein YceI
MNNNTYPSENVSTGHSMIAQIKGLLFAFIILAGLCTSAFAGDFTVDKTGSKVIWEAKKVTGKHNGTISFASGSITAKKGLISAGSFVIDMKTIICEDLTDGGYNKKLIGHLISDDFFGVAKFPESTMTIKTVAPISGDDYKIIADLTIKGITQPVAFTTKVTRDGDKLNAAGVITVNRTLYGIRYGSASFFKDIADKAIADNFTLSFSIVAQKK